MNWNVLLFQIFPYVALALLIIVSFQRMRNRPFSVSSLSSQLLERKLLYFGSIPFHWGLLVILLLHLMAILLPQGLLWWNSAPTRLFLLEITGLILALWTLGGLAILAYRRLSNRRTLAVTYPSDLLLPLLGVSVVTGILTAVMSRFGSYWFPSVLTPYLVVHLHPEPPARAFLADLPVWIQLHVLSFWVLVAVFPFTRLIHIVTLPLGYLWRLWQIVVWIKKNRRHAAPSSAAKAQPGLPDNKTSRGTD